MSILSYIKQSLSLILESIGTLIGIILTGISTVGLFNPDILDPRRRKGRNDLIIDDVKKQSIDYQDKMRRQRFCFAMLFISGFTIAVFSAWLHFLSLLPIYLSP